MTDPSPTVRLTAAEIEEIERVGRGDLTPESAAYVKALDYAVHALELLERCRKALGTLEGWVAIPAAIRNVETLIELLRRGQKQEMRK